jgi:uncharacterized membrane protein YoaK (UPF0700 family)
VLDGERRAGGMIVPVPACGEQPAARAARVHDARLARLALAAGCGDAVSDLGQGRVLTAAMTGNTLLRGVAAGQADAAAALRASTALAGFVMGAVVGAGIVERGARGVVWSPAVALALGLELALLLFLALAWPAAPAAGPGLTLLIVAAGLAMGIQSAVALRIGVPGVATTYVTGTLMSLSARLVRWARAPGAIPPHCRLCDPVAQMPAGWLALVWLAYGAGAVVAGSIALWWPRVAVSPAVAGIFGSTPWPAVALLLPIGVIAGVIGCVALRFQRRQARAPAAGGLN